MSGSDVEASVSAQRPLPVITEQNRPYWEAARRHEFVLPSCQACGKPFFPIGPVCPFCFSGDLGWSRMSGRGKVSSFVIFHQAFFAYYKERIPYAVVQVELAEGPRFNANLFDLPPDQITIGMPVEITFEKVSDEITLPQFRPALGATP